MTGRALLVSALLAAGLLAALYLFLDRQLAAASFVLGVPSEVDAALEGSLVDLKRRAELEPERASELRARHQQISQLLGRLRILELSRGALRRRLGLFFVFVFAILLAVTSAAFLARQRHTMLRLARLREGVERMASGEVSIRVADRGGDAIGRVARMIEEAARTLGVERQRADRLEHLRSWREGARRLAHELRTPMTAAGMTVERLARDLKAEGVEAARMECDLKSLEGDLQAIREVVQRLSSLARWPPTTPKKEELGELLGEFGATFEGAWPELDLHIECEQPLEAVVDRAALRQVLVNLCANASEASGVGRCRVQISARPTVDGTAEIEVSDDGPGLPAALAETAFLPYVSSRRSEGASGLGLAISRALLLEQGGDLELMTNDPESPCPCPSSGARFIIRLPSEAGPVERERWGGDRPSPEVEAGASG